MNINDLFQQASAAPDAPDYPDLLTNKELPQGTELTAEIVYTKAAVNEKGTLVFTNKLRILSGEHTDGEFFDTVYVSPKESAAGFNKRAFAKLAAAGLTGEFFASQPSNEAIAKALLNKKVKVTIAWQKQTAEAIEAGKRPFSEHLWSPATASASGPAGFSPQGF